MQAVLSEFVSIYIDDPALFAGSVFVLGLVVGSFLNVVIYRLPIILERQWRLQASELLELSNARTAEASADLAPFTLSLPRSACPSCKAPIKAWQNIPVISWLLLRGRCASCGVEISVRYPFVEVATGILSAWVAWRFGFSASTACGLVLTWTLIALAGIDIDHQLLPDDMTLPLMWAGLTASVVLGPVAGHRIPVEPGQAVMGAVAGYVSLWLIFHAFRLITGKEGMGYGDFKLFAALGAWLGWKMLPLVILVSAATGAALGIFMVTLRGRDRAAPLPFGPYLAAAGWVAMMYGQPIVESYLRISGLKH